MICYFVWYRNNWLLGCLSIILVAPLLFGKIVFSRLELRSQFPMISLFGMKYMQMTHGTGQKLGQESFSLHSDLMASLFAKQGRPIPSSIPQCCAVLSFLFTFFEVVTAQLLVVAQATLCWPTVISAYKIKMMQAMKSDGSHGPNELSSQDWCIIDVGQLSQVISDVSCPACHSVGVLSVMKS